MNSNRGLPFLVIVVALGFTALGACSSGAKKGAASDAGLDGVTGGDGASDATAPDTDAAGTLTVTNVGPIDFAGTGDVVITSQTAAIRSDTSDITGTSSPGNAYRVLEIAQPLGAPTLTVFIARSFLIEGSAVARVTGARPVVLVALDKIEVFGTLSASGQRATATAGGSACTTTGKGGGPGGGGANASYNAAGGGSFCGVGGAGNAIAGGVAGVGGPAYGSESLVPLLGGSAGGGAPTFAGGGAGGGALQLAAGGSVTVGISGIVEVGGGGGAANGCGGGSGGAILIEAPAVTIAGFVTANGGSGAANTGGPYGQDGQPSSTPAAGGSTTSGAGSAADIINGGAGSIMGTNNNSSGSGGGGAGRIRLNSTGGSATITGTISPAMTTPCFSQGQI